MSASINPSLTVEKVQVTRELRLPGEVLVAPGDSVDPDVEVARARLLSGSPYVVDMGPDLRKSPETRIEVDVGDRVAPGQVVARGPVRPYEVESPIGGLVEYISRSRGRVYLREEPGSEREEVAVNIVEALKVWPSVAWMHVTVEEGDEVEEGQILAAAPGMDGANYAYAPFGGVIKYFDRSAGTIGIRRHIEEYVVKALVPGVVEERIGDLGVVIRGEVGVIRGVYSRGLEAIASLRVVESPEDMASVSPGDVVALLGEPAADTAVRSAQLRVAGLIVGGLDRRDLLRLAEAAPDMPVILVSGFGRLAMPAEFARVIASIDRGVISLSGAAGEAFLPAGPLQGERSRGARAGRPREGDMVRFLDPRHLGTIGTVVRDAGIVEYPTGMNFDSVEVQPISEDPPRMVPVANVETWEEEPGRGGD